MPAKSQARTAHRRRPIAGVGRVLLWNGGSLWIGHAAGSGDVHDHHAIQISLALTGRLKLRSDGGPWHEYTAAMGGMSWTDAAQEWGFADSAHLSRTCRRMFGIAPTMLLREGER